MVKDLSATNFTWTAFDVANATRHMLFKVNMALEVALNPELERVHSFALGFTWGNMDRGQLEDEVQRRLFICKERKMVVRLPDPPPFPTAISRNTRIDPTLWS